MGVFNGPLLTEAVGRVGKVKIDRVVMPFTYTIPIGSSQYFYYRIVVPAGFITDYASIPLTAQRLLGLEPDDPDYAQAAVLHDYLCQNPWAYEIGAHLVMPHNKHPAKAFTRAEVDWVFKDAMKALGCPPWKTTLLYSAVRAYAVLTFK